MLVLCALLVMSSLVSQDKYWMFKHLNDAVICKRYITQVNRMSRSRRVLAIGGKQRILRLDMVCIEMILFHLDSL